MQVAGTNVLTVKKALDLVRQILTTFGLKAEVGLTLIGILL